MKFSPSIRRLVRFVVKACIVFTSQQPDNFQDKMKQVFSLYRGKRKLELSTSNYCAYIQIDDRVGDGDVWHLDGYRLIELGINFSDFSPEQKAAACRTQDPELLRKTLDGEVCQILISEGDGLVTIAGDALGLFPLYFVRDPNKCVLSTDMKAILALYPDMRSRLDEQSILEYLSCHFLYENRTLFEDIELLPEAALARFHVSDPSDWTVESWYSLPKNHETRPIYEWIKLTALALRESLRRRASAGTGILLSGGMDSRTILASIPEHIRKTILALTYGVEGADDCAFAKKVARQFGVSLEHVILDNDIYFENFLKHMWLTEGVSNHMVAPVAPALQRINPPRVLEGFAGDAQFGGGFSDNSEELDSGSWPTRREEYIMKILEKKGYIRPYRNLAIMIAGKNQKEIHDALFQSVKSEVSRMPEDIAPTIQTEMLLFRLRVKRNTIGGAMAAESVSAVMKPYYDLSFLETILRIPAKERRYHAFYMKYLQKIVPETLKDPRTTELPSAPNSKIAKFLKRIIRFAARKTLGVELFPIKYWIPINKWIRENTQYRNWLVDILFDERTRQRGILDIEGLKQLLREHLSGERNLYPVLLSATDLELTLRLLSDGDGFHMFCDKSGSPEAS